MPKPVTVTESSIHGLSSEEAAKRLQQYGPNALEEKKHSAILRLLSYFWGPIPWMIEIAAVLSALVQHWDDFWIIVALLVFNAGFYVMVIFVPVFRQWPVQLRCRWLWLMMWLRSASPAVRCAPRIFVRWRWPGGRGTPPFFLRPKPFETDNILSRVHWASCSIPLQVEMLPRVCRHLSTMSVQLPDRLLRQRLDMCRCFSPHFSPG